MSDTIHVLIVDDSTLARKMCRKSVEAVDDSATIVEAQDGSAALDTLADNTFDVAIIDYNMPGMTGLELASKLREASPQTRIAMCTANIQDDIQNQAKDLDVTFIAKPVNPEKIQSHVTFRA